MCTGTPVEGGPSWAIAAGNTERRMPAAAYKANLEVINTSLSIKEMIPPVTQLHIFLGKGYIREIALDLTMLLPP
jgi:hypothetical protein